MIKFMLIIYYYFSGLLLTYNFLKKFEASNGILNYLIFIIGLYIRYTLPLIGLLLFTYLFPLFGDGPFWTDSNHSLKEYVDCCKKTFHRNLLYINNFYNADHVR